MSADPARNPPSPGVCWALVVVGGAVLGGCAGSLEPARPEGAGVTGRMILLDDTGLPPSAHSGGAMLAVPEASLPVLWQAVGTEAPEREHDLAYTRFVLDAGDVADIDAAVVPVDDRGHFRIPRSGPHLLCRIPDSSETGRGARGCDLVDLPESGAVEATFGEGGFHASVVEPD